MPGQHPTGLLERMAAAAAVDPPPLTAAARDRLTTLLAGRARYKPDGQRTRQKPAA